MTEPKPQQAQPHETQPEVTRADILSPDAQALIAELNDELSAGYPEPGATHFRLAPAEVSAGSGAFFVARLAGEPVGCGAIRRLDDISGEVKRMYVRRGARGKGIARAVLVALESEARSLGLTSLLLETGIRSPEAIRLYESSGFEHIEPYGEYIGSPTSVCMRKQL
ncbi:MAG: hypothetical protein JWO05_3521 [Gemmatimonadetes bacterium]|nr:hypothetical protein [Gemmatimonadota bacterium]